MNTISEKNNMVFLSGEIISEAKFSHEVYGEGFYEMNVLVKRLSGQGDILPVTISDRLFNGDEYKVGNTINAIGQFRSYNKLVNGKSKLMLTVFIREIVDNVTVKNPNLVVLTGFICKEPIYRTTPFNREIADVLVAVNRSYNKSDYIPCIAWGRNARFAKNLCVGEKIAISGRIQSREYQKKFEDESVKTLTAYEVSASKIIALEDEDSFDSDYELELAYSFKEESDKESAVTTE